MRRLIFCITILSQILLFPCSSYAETITPRLPLEVAAPPFQDSPVTTKDHKPLIIGTLGLDQKFLGFHGYIENRNYLHYNNNDDKFFKYELRNNFRLTKEIRLSPQISGKFSLDGKFYDFMNEYGFKRDFYRVKPWEYYMDCSADMFDIRIGQQMIRWGKSDEVNPTDVFTPEDFSEYTNEVERGKRKLPVFAVKADIYPADGYSLETIWIPFFRKSEIDWAGGPWDPYVPRTYRAMGLSFAKDEGPKKFSDSQAAVKLKKQTDDYDLSISYSYHFSPLPALLVNPLTNTVSYDYPRQHTIGADFETVIGKIGYRTEMAYTTRSPFVSYDYNQISTVEYRDAFNFVVGGDYTFSNDLYINIQYAFQYIFDYPSGLATQRYEDSVVWRITQSFMRDIITLKSTGRFYLSSNDLVVENSLIYKFKEDFTIEVGMFLFEGSEEGIFGQYKKNDQVFSRIKYTF